MSKRIQLKRTKGWRLPDNTVNVTRTSVYGNPYKIGLFTRDEVLTQYKEYLSNKLRLNPYFLDSLIGKVLACWCRLDQECHADIILQELSKK